MKKDAKRTAKNDSNAHTEIEPSAVQHPATDNSMVTSQIMTTDMAINNQSSVMPNQSIIDLEHRKRSVNNNQQLYARSDNQLGGSMNKLENNDFRTQSYLNEASKDDLKDHQAQPCLTEGEEPQFAEVAATAVAAGGMEKNADLDAMEAEIDGLRYQKKDSASRGRKPTDNIQLRNTNNNSNGVQYPEESPQFRKRTKKHKNKAESPATLSTVEEQMKKESKKKREKKERRDKKGRKDVEAAAQENSSGTPVP